MVEIIKNYTITVDKNELEIILLGLDALKERGFTSIGIDVMTEKFGTNI